MDVSIKRDLRLTVMNKNAGEYQWELGERKEAVVLLSPIWLRHSAKFDRNT
jgi:hypothetical protein